MGEFLKPLFSLSASQPCSNVELLVTELGHDTQKEKRPGITLWIAYINLYRLPCAQGSSLVL